MKYILAIDIGGTKIAVGIVNFSGRVLIKLVKPTAIKAGAKGIIRQIIRMAQQVISSQSLAIKNLSGIGIGTAGTLDVSKGVIITSPNLPGWKNVQIVKSIKQVFKAPVFLDNDANAAALGEWMFGAGRGTKNMVYLTVSTGIGGGIIINNQLYRGQGNAGELGHMIIEPNGPKCGCGNYGCLEAFSSGTAINQEAKKAPKNNLIWQLAKDKKNVLNASLVFRAAKLKDKFAQQIISRALTALGIGVVNIIHIFHPDKIILGGGVMNNKKYILPFLRMFVKGKIMPGFKKNIKIQAAGLGQDAGLIGAAALVIKRFKK